MNVQDVVTRVRRTFGDDAAVQVTNDDIIRWVNDAQIEVVKHNDAALQTTTTMTITAGTAQYTLPVDLLILRSIRFKFADMLSYSALKFKNMQEFDDSIDGWDGSAYSTGSPAFFTMYEGKIILFPVPDQSNAAGIKLLYNRQPVSVATVSDELSLPLLYHNTVVKYCMWQASLLDEDHEPALMYKGDFQTDMDILQNNETSEPSDKYPTITVLEYDQ